MRIKIYFSFIPDDYAFHSQNPIYPSNLSRYFVKKKTNSLTLNSLVFGITIPHFMYKILKANIIWIYVE